MVSVESDNCDLESFSRENDGLNNGTRQGDVKGAQVCFRFWAFFYEKLTRRVPLFNSLFWVESWP